MDGRDIGTVVFPKAELKLFVQADLQVRVKRRAQELTESGIVVNESTILSNLKHRDHADSSRIYSPLYQADDAIVIGQYKSKYSRTS